MHLKDVHDACRSFQGKKKSNIGCFLFASFYYMSMMRWIGITAIIRKKKEKLEKESKQRSKVPLI